MKIDNEFKIQTGGDDVIIKNINTRTMPISEAVLQLTQLDTELVQVQQNLDKVNKEIEDKVLEEQVKTMELNLRQLNSLKKELVEATQPYMDEKEKELNGIVKIQKAEKGYDRATGDQKVVVRNQIIADIGIKAKMDVNHPIMMKIRQGFDK